MVDKDCESVEEASQNLVFELHGEQMKNRAPDRANRKFKPKYSDDL